MADAQMAQGYGVAGFAATTGAAWTTTTGTAPYWNPTVATWTTVPDTDDIVLGGIKFDKEDLRILRRIIDGIKAARKESGESDIETAVEDAVAALR